MIALLIATLHVNVADLVEPELRAQYIRRAVSSETIKFCHYTGGYVYVTVVDKACPAVHYFPTRITRMRT